MNLVFDLEGTLVNHRLTDGGQFQDLFKEVALLAQSHRLMLLTSKPESTAREVLAQQGAHSVFSRVIGRDSFPKAQSKAESLADLIIKDELDDGDTLMIGDRPQDMHAARGNSVCGIGVLWGNGTRLELEEAGADFLVSDWKDLTDLISAFAEARSTP